MEIVFVEIKNYFNANHMIRRYQKQGKFCYPRLINNKLCLIINDRPMTTQDLAKITK